MAKNNRRRTVSTVAKLGDFDGMLRASSDRYEDFDPRGAFVNQRSLTEADWPEYKTAYEEAYETVLRQYGRGSAS